MSACFRGGRVCGHGAFQAGNAPYGAKRITGNREAATALKLVKDAPRLGQRY
jgi:hypothetical protein